MIKELASNHVRGFAGQTATSNRSTTCDIQVMNAKARINAIVVPDGCLTYDVIVDHDFIEQEHVVTIKRGKELIIKQLLEIESVKM